MKTFLSKYKFVELFAVGMVGLLMSGLLRFVGLGPLVIGTGTYVEGYFVGNTRPPTGWKMLRGTPPPQLPEGPTLVAPV